MKEDMCFQGCGAKV